MLLNGEYQYRYKAYDICYDTSMIRGLHILNNI